MAARQCSSSHYDTHLQPGMIPLHSHIKNKEGKKTERIFTLCNHTAVWRAGGCVNVRACICVYELFVSPPQALGCWVCSLKRLCFCCHVSLSPLCVFLTGARTLSTSVLSARLHHSPSPVRPSVFHYRCFIIIVGKSTRQNAG